MYVAKLSETNLAEGSIKSVDSCGQPQICPHTLGLTIKWLKCGSYHYIWDVWYFSESAFFHKGLNSIQNCKKPEIYLRQGGRVTWTVLWFQMQLNQECHGWMCWCTGCVDALDGMLLLIWISFIKINRRRIINHHLWWETWFAFPFHQYSTTDKQHYWRQN
jgi:hypothetical protein